MVRGSNFFVLVTYITSDRSKRANKLLSSRAERGVRRVGEGSPKLQGKNPPFIQHPCIKVRKTLKQLAIISLLLPPLIPPSATINYETICLFYRPGRHLFTSKAWERDHTDRTVGPKLCFWQPAAAHPRPPWRACIVGTYALHAACTDRCMVTTLSTPKDRLARSPLSNRT